jgi:hypothetical protein
MEKLIQAHMVVEQSLESFLKQQQRAKKKQQPSPCGPIRALNCPQFPVEKFDEIHHIWEASVARRNALKDGASTSGKGGTAADVIVISDDEDDV